MTDLRGASRRAIAAALAGSLALAGSAFALDEHYGPSDLANALAPAAGTLKAGGMVVRLDRFLETRDGKVQAEMSFHNPNDLPVSYALDAGSTGAPRLTNANGVQYRLKEISQLAETQDDWTSVPPGGSAALTATFELDTEGASRGVQPFALEFPVRMQWQPDDAQAQRTSLFDLNFRGLRRAAEQALAAPQPRVELAALPVAPQVTPTAPSPLTPSLPQTSYDDDLAPLVADLPAAKPDSRRYLFAVGVNEYDDAPSVPFADRSAKLMSDLLRKRYGIPEENMTVITGAEATGIRVLGRLNSLIQRLTPGDTVYFYYAGHGLSARGGNAVYVVPKDAVPGAYEVEMLSLASLLQRFESSPAARVVAFLDTCFSGRVGRDQSLFPGVAPLVPTPLPTATLQSSGKITLFLAGQGNQFANDYPEHGHRLFSYFLMRGLLDRRDDAADLSSFAAREVRRVSSKRGAEFLQEPRFEGTARSLASGLPSRVRAEATSY